MYIFNARMEKVQLARLDTEVLEDPATGRAAVAVASRRGRDPVNASALVSRASRAFFEIGGQQPGKAAAIAPQVGPPPVAFRETASGLLHVVYREIVIRFAHATSQKRRQQILKKDGFEIRRENPLIPDQVVVYDPRRKHSGEELVEVSNRWMELDEVVFSTPNFVSQFLRQVPPSIRSEEWHLKNAGGDGAKAGEDVDVLTAWKTTKGRPEIVVAVLDDGVDVEHPGLIGNVAEGGRDFFVPADNPEHLNPRPKKFNFPFPWSGGVNPDIEQALEDAGQLGRGGRGAAIFCAAGNGFGSPVGFPARDPNAIAVGASTDQALKADYSNVGPQLAFVAPSSGGIRGIFTTDVSLANRGFNTGTKEQGGEDGLHTNSFGGTSSATPLAAGVGALVLSVNPNLSRSDLRNLLARTTDKIGSGYDAQGHSNELGSGRINAGKAVVEAKALASQG